MCQSSTEGGRRCADYERLKEASARDFAPGPTEGTPDVVWRNDDLSKTWGRDADGRADGCAALLTLERVKAAEPEMTQTMKEVAHHVGGECAYLQARVKSPESLARKISTDRAREARRGEKLSPSQAAAKMNDVVRYTIVKRDHASLTETTAATVIQLQSEGWAVKRIKSFYRDGAPYKGLHVICESPTGCSSELQIHSAQSMAAKEAAHQHYEIYRDRTRSKKEREKAKAACERIYADVSIPPGLEAVGAMGRKDIGRVPLEKQV